MSNREVTGPFGALRTMLPVPRFTFVPEESLELPCPDFFTKLLAVRSLLDAAIRRLDETGEPETVHIKVKQAEE